MNVTIAKNYRNELLKRNELEGEIQFTGATPSNNDLISKLASGKDSQLVVIKKIGTSYGSTKAKFTAVIYDSVDQLKNVEKLSKKQQKPVAKTGEA